MNYVDVGQRRGGRSDGTQPAAGGELQGGRTFRQRKTDGCCLTGFWSHCQSFKFNSLNLESL